MGPHRTGATNRACSACGVGAWDAEATEGTDGGEEAAGRRRSSRYSVGRAGVEGFCQPDAGSHGRAEQDVCGPGEVL